MWKRYLSPTPANVARLLIGVKGILGTAAGGVFISGNPTYAFWLMVAIGVINEAASFLSPKKEENDTKN
jgi:hypothetical protein